jgi:hypothetical protein
VIGLGKGIYRAAPLAGIWVMPSLPRRTRSASAA